MSDPIPEHSLTFEHYQAETAQFARYPDIGKNPFYPLLGLGGEAGELAQKILAASQTVDEGLLSTSLRALAGFGKVLELVKKGLRDDGGELTPERRAALHGALNDMYAHLDDMDAAEDYGGMRFSPALEELEGMQGEVGDVDWYLSQEATELGIKRSRAARLNLEKLASRRDRDKLHGEGDDR